MRIIRNASLRGRDGHWDVALEGEEIAAVEPRVDADADFELDAEGRLLVPHSQTPTSTSTSACSAT
jgi:hypothetical protein